MPATLVPPRIDTATRRQVLGGAGVLLLTAACGNELGPTATGTGGVPILVTHQYGTTEIPAPPKRVVTVGLTDHDPVLALGLEPVGVAEWYGDYPYAAWPWAQYELGTATPQIVATSTAIEFEAVAALQPDLITAVNYGLTRDQYDTLSQIAPTVGPSGRYPEYGTPWQVLTRMIGRSVGRPRGAEQLVRDVENRFAAARRKHPGFAERTAAFVLPAPDGTLHLYASVDVRARFLRSFGFAIPERLDRVAGEKFYAEVSFERLGLLDGIDVLVWDAANSPPGKIEEIQNGALYQQLDLARHSIFVEDTVTLGAIAWSTVLSLPLAIDRLVPRLAATVDGDTATSGE